MTVRDRELIEKSWSKSTTYCPDEYVKKDPAFGQCAVTALLVYCLYGGSLIKGKVKQQDGYETTHYWNVIDGVTVDLTWRQFTAGSTVLTLKVADMEDLLFNKWTVSRFEKLLFNYERASGKKVSLPGKVARVVKA